MAYLFIFLTRFSKIQLNYGIRGLVFQASQLREREREKRGRESYRSAVRPTGRNSQGNRGLGKSVREREKGRGGAKMLKVQGVKAAAQKWRGKGTGEKKKRERVYVYICVCACKRACE